MLCIIINFRPDIISPCINLCYNKRKLKGGVRGVMFIVVGNMIKENSYFMFRFFFFFSNVIFSEISQVLLKVSVSHWFIGSPMALVGWFVGLLVGWLVVWVLWHINLCSLFYAKSIFLSIISSLSNNLV